MSTQLPVTQTAVCAARPHTCIYICYSAPVVGVAIGTPLFPLKRLSSLSLSLSLSLGLYIISLAQLSKSRAVRRGLQPATRSMSKMNVPLRYADS